MSQGMAKAFISKSFWIWVSLWVPFLFLPLVPSGCTDREEAFRLELRKSFLAYLNALESMDEEALRATVFFPDTNDYKAHVQALLLQYLEQAQKNGTVAFDPQGVVACRFLGLSHFQYTIVDVKKLDEKDLVMRIGIHYAYDSNLSRADYEKGTKVLIPGKPLGTVLTLVIGGENPAPREQLKYAELEIVFRKTNFENHWQVRELRIDEARLEFEVSFKDDF